METKRVLILANSEKKGERCIAGRELIEDGGETRWGCWIRPVSSASEGQLSYAHYLLSNGRSAGVFDVVDMQLLRHNDDPGQPENWLLDHSSRWTLVRTFPASEVRALEEGHPDLWMEDISHSDRISVAGQLARTPQRSLLIIRPSNFHLRLWTRFNPWKERNQSKTHAVFKYAGLDYSLSLTDPIFKQDHAPNHPAESEPAIEVTPTCANNCLLCVSLTPPFKGYHYKVVATVLCLP